MSWFSKALENQYTKHLQRMSAMHIDKRFSNLSKDDRSQLMSLHTVNTLIDTAERKGFSKNFNTHLAVGAASMAGLGGTLGYFGSDTERGKFGAVGAATGGAIGSFGVFMGHGIVKSMAMNYYTGARRMGTQSVDRLGRPITRDPRRLMAVGRKHAPKDGNDVLEGSPTDYVFPWSSRTPGLKSMYWSK